MSINLPTPTVTAKRRTNETRLSSPLGPTSGYSLVMQREVVITDSAGNVIQQRGVIEITRGLPDIAAQSVTVPIAGTPTAVTAAEVMSMIAAFGDVWDQEEITAGRGGD